MVNCQILPDIMIYHISCAVGRVVAGQLWIPMMTEMVSEDCEGARMNVIAPVL